MDNLLVEIRYAVDDTRESAGRIVGTLLTYGESARDRAERFIDDALLWDDAGIVLNEQHNREAGFARAHPYVEGRAVKIDAKVPNTQRGRDAITNIREGVYTGLSIEFERSSVEARQVGGVREIRRARLMAAALVDTASYRGSTVSVRHAVEADADLLRMRRIATWL